MIEYIEYLLFRLAAAIAGSIPFRTAGRIGAVLGGMVFDVTGVRKRVTLENLRYAFPELNEEERRAIARGAYQNYGIALMEFLWAGKKSLDEIVQVLHLPDNEILSDLRSRECGVLFLSGHFGSWEFMIPGASCLFERPLAAVVQRQRNKRVDAIIDGNRSRFRNTTIPMGVSSRNVLKALAEKKAIIILGDQSGPREAVFIDFFGRPAATHRGTAAFSLKTGCPIIMCFIVRQHDGTHALMIEEVDRSGLQGSHEDKVVELTRRHVAVLEKWIRRHPDHWLWMHKRWKHTPPGQEGHT